MSEDPSRMSLDLATFKLTDDHSSLSRPSGGFVDQDNVGLINGGGTLLLGTHDNVRIFSYGSRVNGLINQYQCLPDHRTGRAGFARRRERCDYGVP